LGISKIGINDLYEAIKSLLIPAAVMT